MNVSIVKLGPTTKQISRLADAAERIAKSLELMCGISDTPQKQEEETAGEPQISYSSDEESAIREANAELERLGLRKPEDVEPVQP